MRISGFSSRVSCCGFRVSRSGFQVDLSTVDAGMRVQGSVFPGSGCGWRKDRGWHMDHSGRDLVGWSYHRLYSGSGFRISGGCGWRISCLLPWHTRRTQPHWTEGSGSRVPYFRFRVAVSVFRDHVSCCVFRDWCCGSPFCGVCVSGAEVSVC